MLHYETLDLWSLLCAVTPAQGRLPKPGATAAQQWWGGFSGTLSFSDMISGLHGTEASLQCGHAKNFKGVGQI